LLKNQKSLRFIQQTSYENIKKAVVTIVPRQC